MRSKIYAAAAILGLCGFVYAVVVGPSPAAADELKNLQVLPKTLSKKQLKDIMKKVGKAVDKSCDDCHDLEDFSKDTEMKKTAREMFKLTNAINARLKKEKLEGRVTCNTCHRGEAKPKGK